MNWISVAELSPAAFAPFGAIDVCRLDEAASFTP
jgi:hypothetical protein